MATPPPPTDLVVPAADDTMGTVLSRASTLNIGSLYGASDPPTYLTYDETKLPSALKTQMDTCDGNDNCKLVAADITDAGVVTANRVAAGTYESVDQTEKTSLIAIKHSNAASTISSITVGAGACVIPSNWVASAAETALDYFTLTPGLVGTNTQLTQTTGDTRSCFEKCISAPTCTAFASFNTDPTSCQLYGAPLSTRSWVGYTLYTRKPSVCPTSVQSSVATVTTTRSHLLNSGDYVKISETGVPALEVPSTSVTVTDATHFTYPVLSSVLGSSTSQGIVESINNFDEFGIPEEAKKLHGEGVASWRAPLVRENAAGYSKLYNARLSGTSIKTVQLSAESTLEPLREIQCAKACDDETAFACKGFNVTESTNACVLYTDVATTSTDTVNGDAAFVQGYTKRTFNSIDTDPTNVTTVPAFSYGYETLIGEVDSRWYNSAINYQAPAASVVDAFNTAMSHYIVKLSGAPPTVADGSVEWDNNGRTCYTIDACNQTLMKVFADPNISSFLSSDYYACEGCPERGYSKTAHKVLLSEVPAIKLASNYQPTVTINETLKRPITVGGTGLAVRYESRTNPYTYSPPGYSGLNEDLKSIVTSFTQLRLILDVNSVSDTNIKSKYVWYGHGGKSFLNVDTPINCANTVPNFGYGSHLSLNSDWDGARYIITRAAQNETDAFFQPGTFPMNQYTIVPWGCGETATRTIAVTTPPSNGGRACPSTVQTKTFPNMRGCFGPNGVDGTTYIAYTAPSGEGDVQIDLAKLDTMSENSLWKSESSSYVIFKYEGGKYRRYPNLVIWRRHWYPTSLPTINDLPPRANRNPFPGWTAQGTDDYKVLDTSKFGTPMPDPYEALDQFQTFIYTAALTDVNLYSPSPGGSYSWQCGNAGRCTDGWAKYNCDTIPSTDGDWSCDPSKDHGRQDWETTPDCNGKRVYCVPPVVSSGESVSDARHKYFAMQIAGLRVVSTEVFGAFRGEHELPDLNFRTVYEFDPSSSALFDAEKYGSLFPLMTLSKIKRECNPPMGGYSLPNGTCACQFGKYNLNGTCTVCPTPLTNREVWTDASCHAMTCASGSVPDYSQTSCTVCPNFFDPNVNGGICVDTCGSFYTGRVCATLGECPAGKQYHIDGKFECLAACPSTHLFYKIVGWERRCVAQCSDLGGTHYTYGSQCVTACPAAAPYVTNGVCGVSCAILRDNDTCVTECPAAKVNLNSVCAAGCDSTKPYIYNQTCVAACPIAAPLVDYDGVSCTTACPGGGWFADNGICRSQCPADRPIRSSSGCVTECPAGTALDKVLVGVRLQDICVSSCSYLRFRYNGVCYNACPEPTFVAYPTGDTAGVMEETCATSCNGADVRIPSGTYGGCSAACDTDFPYLNSGTCVATCPVGTFLYGTNCISQCPAGTYKVYDAYSGQTTCANCPVGQTSSAGASVCTNCSAGTYNNVSGASGCTSCLAGTYSSSSGATGCTNCAAGTAQAATGASGCASCTAGTAQAATGATSCTPCTAGKYSSAAGATACTNCAAGSAQAATGASGCASCTAGSAQAATGATSCTPCAAGKYSSAGGATTCTNCSAGTAQAATGASGCASCTAGTAQAATGATSCTPCTAGKYSSVGASGCTNCSAGTAQAATGATGCTPCTAGSSSATGATGCTSCSGATPVSVQGGLCVATCPFPYYTASSSQCVSACPASASYIWNSACNIQCPANTYNSSYTCTNCAAGKYSAAGTGTTCSDCSPGQTSLAGSGCTSCLAGTYSSAAGATGCTKCTAGTAQAATGASGCTACVAGTAQAATGATSCTACTAGKYSSVGATGCTNCAAGSAQAATGASGCTACVAGTAQAATGATSCTACAAGKYSSAGGATACSTCLAGTYSSSASSTACTPCAAGTFVASSGATGAVDCGAGTYSTGGVSVCTNCPGGTAFAGTKGTSSSVCATCLPGTYSTGGAASCTACAGDTVSAAGSSGCQISCDLSILFRFGKQCLTTCPDGWFNYRGECAFSIPDCSASSSCGSTVTGKCYIDLSGAPSGCTRCNPDIRLNSGGYAFCETGTTTLCKSTSGSGTGGVCKACPTGQVGRGSAYCEVAPSCTASYYVTEWVDVGTIPVCAICPMQTYAKTINASACTACPAGRYTQWGSASNPTYAGQTYGCQYPSGKTDNSIYFGSTIYRKQDMHVPTATGTDISTMTGTAAQCAATCTSASTCKGFTRSSTLADTTSGTCIIKGIVSDKTNKWSAGWNTFVKIPDQNQAIYGVNSSGATWKHDGIRGYAGGGNNGWLQITNVGQSITLLSFTQLQNGTYVGTTTGSQVVYKYSETGVWTTDNSWSAGVASGARVTRRYWLSNSVMLLGTNGNVYWKDFNNINNTWSLWWSVGTNVMSIMEHPDTPDRFVAVLNDNKVWEYNGNPLFMARNTWTNISPGSVRNAVYNMASQIGNNDKYDYFPIIAIGTAPNNDVMWKLSVAAGAVNNATGLYYPVGTWTQVTGSCCVTRIG